MLIPRHYLLQLSRQRFIEGFCLAIGSNIVNGREIPVNLVLACEPTNFEASESRPVIGCDSRQHTKAIDNVFSKEFDDCFCCNFSKWYHF